MHSLLFIPTAPPPDEQEHVWRADQVGLVESEVMGTGFPALDRVLPGGGWPVGALTELLHASHETHAWPLLLPALAQAVGQRKAPVLLVGPPHAPFGPALAAHGLPPEALLWVRCDAPAARLWACEQALRCADVAAVLAWLPQARVAELRRLQLAAAQHDALLWVFRPAAAAGASSPARLRLQVEALPGDAGQLEVQVLKRRGPPLASALHLPSQPQRLSALIAASRERAAVRRAAEGTVALADAGAPVPAAAALKVVRISTNATDPQDVVAARAATAATAAAIAAPSASGAGHRHALVRTAVAV